MSDFYIVGTKYGDNNDVDILPDILEKQAISIGFCWDIDLTQYYNGNFKELNELLRKKKEKGTTISQVERFLSLKPGDIVALKNVGSPLGKTARLEIAGYAVVVERNGAVYTYDPGGLGHLVSVDFLETNIKRTLQLGYGRSIHKLQNKEHINLIFGSYSNIVPQGNKVNLTQHSGTATKNVLETSVTVTATYIRKATHNKIQKAIYDMWVKQLGTNSVKMEENYVDIVITTKGTTELIEIKPYTTAIQCIREGLGQLLDYYHKHYSNRNNVSLTIIGHNEPNADDKKFIKFIENTLNMNFRYDSWERLKEL